jgi:hypothetical protein
MTAGVAFNAGNLYLSDGKVQKSLRAVQQPATENIRCQKEKEGRFCKVSIKGGCNMTKK